MNQNNYNVVGFKLQVKRECTAPLATRTTLQQVANTEVK